YHQSVRSHAIRRRYCVQRKLRNPRCFWHPARIHRRMRIPVNQICAIAGAAMLLVSCAARPGSGGATAKVTVEPAQVQLGREIHFQVQGAPPGWSGEITVNARHFAVSTERYSLRATIENGFQTNRPTELFFMLRDGHGRELPIANRGYFEIGIKPNLVDVSPESTKLGASGGAGNVVVRAKPESSWSVAGLPDWIHITSADRGAGNGIIS